MVARGLSQDLDVNPRQPSQARFFPHHHLTCDCGRDVEQVTWPLWISVFSSIKQAFNYQTPFSAVFLSSWIPCLEDRLTNLYFTIHFPLWVIKNFSACQTVPNEITRTNTQRRGSSLPRLQPTQTPFFFSSTLGAGRANLTFSDSSAATCHSTFPVRCKGSLLETWESFWSYAKRDRCHWHHIFFLPSCPLTWCLVLQQPFCGLEKRPKRITEASANC